MSRIIASVSHVTAVGRKQARTVPSHVAVKKRTLDVKSAFQNLCKQSHLGVEGKQVLLEVCHTIGRAHSNLEDFIPTDEAGKPAMQRSSIVD